MLALHLSFTLGREGQGREEVICGGLRCGDHDTQPLRRMQDGEDKPAEPLGNNKDGGGGGGGEVVPLAKLVE